MRLEGNLGPLLPIETPGGWWEIRVLPYKHQTKNENCGTTQNNEETAEPDSFGFQSPI